MRLIPNAGRAWRMLSVQIAGASVVFGTLPADQQAGLLSLIGVGPERIPAMLGLAVILARLIDQPKTREAGE